LELLSFVLHYPASWQWARDRATTLIAEVGADLPPEVVVADRARGSALELESTVAELLVELGD
jgi:hypothetical protein